MKKTTGIFKSAVTPVILLFMSIAGIILYYPGRATWVFIDITLKIEGATFYLLYLMIINTLVLGALAVLKSKKAEASNKKAYRALLVFSGILAAVICIIGIVSFIINLTEEMKLAYLLRLRESLFAAALFVFVPVFGLFAGLFKGRTGKAFVTAGVLIALFMALSQLVPFTPYKITSEPTVIDTGKDYSVVFSTNDFGSGYVEYTYAGKSYKVYDENGGRLNSDSKIHSISIPYEHLDNNVYKIGSVRVIEQYSYGSRTGKELLSEEYSFSPAKENETTFLVISDWHTQLQSAKKAIEYVGEYDAIILLGDATPGVDYEEQVVQNIVEFSGDLSKGKIPVLYVRGNHETRGEYAGKLLDALGLDEFYYTAQMGGCSFVVLDSGEDKDDSHPEYGGMNDYNTYRNSMVEWLKTVECENDRVIALSHSWKISDVEEELSASAWNELDRLGTALLLSGHEHKCRLVGESSEEEKAFLSAYPEIVAYVDGGKNGKDFIASKMIVSDERIILEAYKTSGEKVFEHEIQW